jgi:hypothetical protein
MAESPPFQGGDVPLSDATRAAANRPANHTKLSFGYSRLNTYRLFCEYGNPEYWRQ